MLVSQGVIQNLKPYTTVELTEPQTVQVTGADGKTTTQTVTEQVIAQGPVASQEVIKEFGTNGGGFFNANSAHPFENPTPLSNFLEICVDLRDLLGAHLHAGTHDRFAAPRLGRVGGDGGSVPGGRDVPSIGPRPREIRLLAGVDQHASAMQSGGNMEGKEVRFGIANSACLPPRQRTPVAAR